MSNIKVLNDTNQLISKVRFTCLHMVFSKTFGYALRSVLYIAMLRDEKPRIQLDEIAEKLSVPRHFLGNVMKGLVKEGILNSMKGPFGGFCVNQNTREVTLSRLREITGEIEDSDSCVLRFRKCNAITPCPLHSQIEKIRQQWQLLLSSTTIGDLTKNDQSDFIKTISSVSLYLND